MDNVEITEDRLVQRGWKKVGNTFYRDKKAVTHFDGKFQIWANASYRHIKTMTDLHVYTAEETEKKPGY